MTVLLDKVRAADAVLFSLTEHNYGFLAAEKNVLDRGSRPYAQNVWTGKPAGLMRATTGTAGGARARYELRPSMAFVNKFWINRPDLNVPFTAQQFDAHGRLTDAPSRKFIGDHLVELERFARQLRPDR